MDHFKIWTQVRTEEGPLYGMWEFPGGKIEINESPDDAIVREVFEEVGIEIKNVSERKLFKIQEYSSLDKEIVLYVFISPYDQLPPEKGQWLDITFSEKSSYLVGKIPKINHVIIDELTVYMEKLKQNNLMDHLWTMSKS